jgi:hypothetical protein
MHFYLYRWLRISQGSWIPIPILLTEPLFSILAAWKWDSSKVVWHSTHKYLAFKKPLFGLLEALHWESSRVMRLLVEIYRAFDVQLFVILEAWKSDSCHVVKSSNPGQLASCQPLLDILATWKWDSSNVYVTFRSGVSSFPWDTIKFYGDLKKRFLNRPEIFCGTLRG